MFKKLVPALAATALLTTAVPSAQAFDVGGVNGWEFSTDGIVDVFSVYQTASPTPAGTRSVSFLNPTNSYDQAYNTTVGLLPSVVGINIKAPTVDGVDSSVRIGIYPSIQNANPGVTSRFNVAPNVDFREMNYTAKGAYGELLAGRALNLYQGKNILTDMTLLTAGVIPSPTMGTSTTLGHIGYGYLYTNFGPQLRYTTPDFAGAKVAFSVNQPYRISADTAKTPTPRLETEISYGKTFDGTTLQAWASGLYQSATRSETATTRPGAQDLSLGGAAGAEVGFAGVDLVASGYYGEGLGMISVQDGDAFGSSSTDATGNNRNQYGFLLQATYKLTPSVKIGANYGQSAQERSSADEAGLTTASGIPMFKQEAATAMVAYNLNKFTQFILEYTYAQNTWMDDAKQHSNSMSFGTMFYW